MDGLQHLMWPSSEDPITISTACRSRTAERRQR